MGFGWYDEGEEVRVSIAIMKFEKDLKVYTFQGWKQDGTLVSRPPSYVFRVYAPVTLKAKWAVEELIAVPMSALTGGLAAALIVTLVLIIKSMRRKAVKTHFSYFSEPSCIQGLTMLQLNSIVNSQSIEGRCACETLLLRNVGL